MKRREFLTGAAAVAAGAALAVVADGVNQASGSATAPAATTETAATSPQRQYVFIIDLNLCDGCRMCTVACQAEMQVPPAWGGEVGYAGLQAWIEVFDMGGGVFMPVPCQNCQNAPCAKVCPVGATYYNEDHIVLIDQDRCIGCRYCVVACPYERRFFNWFNPPTAPEDKDITYSPDYNVPHRLGVAEKCIWCAHRVAEDVVPACVEACETYGMKALWFGDAAQGVVSNGKDVSTIEAVTEKRAAYTLNPELGTLPQVQYLPPKGATT